MKRKDFYKQQFTRAEVVEVTGVVPTTFQNWLNRGLVSIEQKQKGGIRRRRLFSPFDIVKVASLVQMTLFKVPPSDANQIIKSENFGKWVDEIFTALTDQKSNPAWSHLLVIIQTNERFAATYVSGATEWEMIEEEHGSFSLGSMAYFTLKLGSIIEWVVQQCEIAILKDMNPKDLTPKQEAILILRERIELDEREERINRRVAEMEAAEVAAIGSEGTSGGDND